MREMIKQFECVSVKRHGRLEVQVRLVSTTNTVEEMELLAPMLSSESDVQFIVGRNYLVTVEAETEEIS